MPAKPYLEMVSHVESLYREHGDNHRGMGWFRPEQVEARYDAMAGLLAGRESDVSLLDFGCGAAHFLAHLEKRGVGGVRYVGIDLSRTLLELCRAKHPGVDFRELDVLEPGAEVPDVDYVVMNGIFTQKLDLDRGAMFAYAEALLSKLFAHARVGLAFNVMSKHVDWERDDLFHVGFDELSALIVGKLTRHFVIHHAYGLHEYTVYLFKRPVAAWNAARASTS